MAESLEDKMKKLFLFLAIISLPRCSIFEEDANYTYPAGIDSVAIESSEFRTIEFSTHIFCGSMCWNGYYFEKSEYSDDIYFKLYVFSNGNACPDVCVHRFFPYRFRSPHSGSYTFHFWRNDSTSIDTTINFN